MKKYTIIAVDFDGILCDKNKKPIQFNIDKVNCLFNTKDNFIVINTSRNHEMYLNLVNWLETYHVLYNSISMNKMKASIYIDDRNREL